MCQHSSRRTSPPQKMRNTQDKGIGRTYPQQQGHQSPRQRKTGHSIENLSPNAEFADGRSPPYKLPKGRKASSTQFVFGQAARQSSPISYGSGSRSSGSSPTKLFSNTGILGTTPGRSVKSPSYFTPSRSSSPKEGKVSPTRSPVPNLAYAGAKFSDPPSPKVLPKPPTHWVATGHLPPKENCTEMTNVLKVMLKVQC